MGGKQAAAVLTSIKREQMMKAGTTVDEAALQSLEQEILDKYEEEGSAYYSTARLWDDGIIDPKDTRDTLARAFEICQHQKIKATRFGVFRM
jgi:acetyl-CoA carboxylase carboxyltransferase component